MRDMSLSRLLRHARRPAILPGLIWKNLKYPFTAQAAEKRYDRRLGIDTGGWIQPQDLDIDGAAAGRSEAYAATPPRIAEFLIARIAEHTGNAIKDFTFVDVGSGKGRVLLIAARFAFRKVVGLEQSSALNAIAADNI